MKAMNSGVFSLLQSAIQKESDSDHSIHLKGDLCQMAFQKSFLISRGISVAQNDVYPSIRPCDKERVFSLFWEFKPDGWHHYCDIYVEMGFCTKEEFIETLRKRVEAKENG